MVPTAARRGMSALWGTCTVRRPETMLAITGLSASPRLV